MLAVVAVLAALVMATAPAGAQTPGTYQRQPVGVDGQQPNGETTVAGVSADGRLVALTSAATNLVAGGADWPTAVFVWDRQTGTVRRQPAGVNGEQPNWDSQARGISANGTKVYFSSGAGNLVPGWQFAAEFGDVTWAYVWDLTTNKVVGQPQRDNPCEFGEGVKFTSTRPTGASGDGSKVALASTDCSLVPDDDNVAEDVLLWQPATGALERQPAGTGPAQPNGYSQQGAISADGTVVPMGSAASNLVAGDTNGHEDAFVWGRTASTYVRQPSGADGKQPDGDTAVDAASADARAVLLASRATNLVAGDTNGRSDVFVWDRTANGYQRQPAGLDGKQPDGASTAHGMSADGTKVLIGSTAGNYRCAGCAARTDGQELSYLWDRSTGKVTEIKGPAGGTGCVAPTAPFVARDPQAVSGNGRYAVVATADCYPSSTPGTDYPGLVVWDRTTGSAQRQPLGNFGQTPNGAAESAVASFDGSKVAFTTSAFNLVRGTTDTPGDVNGFADVYVWNRSTSGYERQPLGVGGAQPDYFSVPAAVSNDNSKVVLTSWASNLVPGDLNGESDVVVWNRWSGTYQRQPNGFDGKEPDEQSRALAVSADGTKVLLSSYASNLVAGDTNHTFDLFVWDRTTGKYARQPYATGPAEPNGRSTDAEVSFDGSKVAIRSEATNLVTGDTNGTADTFVWNRSTGRYERQPNGVGGAQPNGESVPAAVSKDNSKVVLTTSASNLVTGDTNGKTDVVVWNRWSGTYQRQPLGTGGAQPNGDSLAVGISADGTKVLVISAASNLVPGDTNGKADAFVWNRTTGTYQRQPLGTGGTQPNGDTTAAALSADAATVALSSLATNLVTGDTNGQADAFAWAR